MSCADASLPLSGNDMGGLPRGGVLPDKLGSLRGNYKDYLVYYLAALPA